MWTMTTTQTLLSKKKINLEWIKRLSIAHLHGRKVYICPRCKKRVPYKSRRCPFCNERYYFTIHVPLCLLKNIRNGIATKELHDYVHTYLFPKLDLFDQKYLEQYFTITLVQGPARGTGDIISGNYTVTLDSTPASGNLLILCSYAGAQGTNPHVTGVSQTNVIWTQVATVSDNSFGDSEIWKGVVSASAGTVLTISVTGGTGDYGWEIADCCEWSGLSGVVDKTNYNNGGEGTSSDSGTTATTTQNDELVVAGIGATASAQSHTNAQSSPTNGFTLLDGTSTVVAIYSYASVGYLYKIVSATATYNTGTTIAYDSYWVGCIATFKAYIPPITFESYIQLYSEGAGKKYRHRERTVGANTVLEKALRMSQVETYFVVNTAAQTHVQNLHFISLFNASGSGKKVVVKDVKWLNGQLAAITNPTAIEIDVKLTTAQGSGGTTLTPQKFDSGNPAVPAQVTALQAPSTPPTEGNVAFPLYVNQEEVPVDSEWSFNILSIFGRGVRKSHCQRIVLNEGEGITIKQISAPGSPAGASSFQIIFNLV